ncbi:hypothetical protein MMC18_008470 [Xylographa bjoerkii]|nr:hypothetical protein [Xylographa bjoerkii]
MDFRRLSADSSRAYFSDDEILDKYRGEIRGRLQSRRRDRATQSYAPVHTVSVRRILNDTELPDFAFHSEELEVSCDWKGLFSALLYEEQLYQTKLHVLCESEGKDTATRLRAALDADSLDMEGAFRSMLYQYSSSNDVARRDARRQRLSRQIASDLSESPLVRSMEPDVLRQLKDARFHSSFDEYSDDECEEEERLQHPAGDEWVSAGGALEE